MRLLLLSMLCGCAAHAPGVDALAELADARAATSGPDVLVLDEPAMLSDPRGIPFEHFDGIEGPPPQPSRRLLRGVVPPPVVGTIYVDLERLRR